MHRSLSTLIASLALAATLPVPGLAQSQPARLTLGGPPPAVRTEAGLRAFLDGIEAQEMAIAEALSIESYNQWKGATAHRAGEFSRLLSDLTARKDYAAILERWHGRVKDSTLARRLFLDRRDFLLARVDPRLPIRLIDLQTAIQDTVGQFRYAVRGAKLTGTAIQAVLDTSADRSLREEAYRARLQVAPHIGPSIARAMRLNDSIGRAEGFADGAAAGLYGATLEPARVLADLDAFEKATHDTWTAVLERARRDLGVDRVEPWDLDTWLHRQEVAAGAGVEAWPQAPGLARLRDLMIATGFAYDSMPIDVKVWDVPTGGITFPVRPGFEARLLTNPFPGSNFYETLFHEYGHALNFTLMRPDLPPIFLRGDETPLTEGLAETIGHFAYDRHWLERAAGVPADRALALERVGKLQLLAWIRRSIAANAHAEISLYLHPRANRDSLFAASYGKFVGLAVPDGLVATRDMFATGPLYYQSYLYANMIAAQLREAMRAEFSVDDLTREPRVARWLTERFFAMGGAVPWPEKVRRATGHALTAEALGRYLADAGK